MDAVAGSNLKIARRANAQARADFATWQMMVKLKSETTLSADARAVLADYNTLKAGGTEDNAASEQVIQALYRRYYADMGGTGEPPASDTLQPRVAAPAVQRDASSSANGGRDNVTPFRPRPKTTVKSTIKAGHAGDGRAGEQTGARFARMFASSSRETRKIPAWMIFVLLVCAVALIRHLLA